MIRDGESNRLKMVLVLKVQGTVLVSEIRYDHVTMSPNEIVHFNWVNSGLGKKSVIYIANTFRKKKSDFERKNSRVTREELSNAWDAYVKFSSQDSNLEAVEG